MRACKKRPNGQRLQLGVGAGAAQQCILALPFEIVQIVVALLYLHGHDFFIHARRVADVN